MRYAAPQRELLAPGFETGLPGLWEIHAGEIPVVATAIHAGHALRRDVAEHLILAEDVRRREEDPGTERFLPREAWRVVVRRSRFEVDVNRPRDMAVYRRPEDAWGLEMWEREPPPELVDRSLARYDAFYRGVHRLLRRVEARFGRFVVLDVHSYNHRRGGPEAAMDPAAENPEINVGTGGLDRRRWAPVVEPFLDGMRLQRVRGRRLDVRENVRFEGGHFPRWVARSFPATGCPLAIEVKKVFMDEWTGEGDRGAMREVRGALEATVPALLDALGLVDRAEAV
jgi:N-formylglutamate amidohydrolase